LRESGIASGRLDVDVAPRFVPEMQVLRETHYLCATSRPGRGEGSRKTLAEDLETF